MNLLFRTDASVRMGTGHVMRCLALAQAWQDAGGRAVFAMAEATPAIQARLGGQSCEIIGVTHPAGSMADSHQLSAYAVERNADWVVVDGYQFGSEYQRRLKEAGARVLFLDDYGHCEHYFADLVLNQNAGFDESIYQHREAYTRLLLGPSYCLLRREFSVWRNWKRELAPTCSHLLVLMGGSDPDNLSARVIQSLRLAETEGIGTTIVVGGSSPHFSALEEEAARSGQKITVLRDAADMPGLMAAADVAVSAAGSTCWELCLLGLPALLIDVAANQTALARELDRQGCAIHVGNHQFTSETLASKLRQLVNSFELRMSLSQRARRLVDGAGASRVVDALRGGISGDPSRRPATDGGPHVHAPNLRMRRARPEDARLLWEWVNDPEVRQASFSSAQIAWETHVDWFSNRLDSRDCLLLIAENDGSPCGQIRFEASGDGEWDVGVSVPKGRRGLGLASQIIATGAQQLLAEHHGTRIHAYVKAANQASIRAFERAGFRRIGSEEVRGHAAVHLLFDQRERLNP